MMTTDRKQIDTMRTDVTRLAGGVAPDSTSVKHLTERLSELRTIVPVSVSMSRAAKGAVDRVLEAKMPGRKAGRSRLSELVRAALAEYARNHGHAAEAALIEEGGG